jgi:predicted nucleic acid-binding protein
MSWINLGEVFSVIRRLQGEGAARATVRDLRTTISLELPTEHRVLDAAWLKADHRMAYADAFAASTAIAHDAVLLTGDPELLIDDAPWRFEDLRSSLTPSPPPAAPPGTHPPAAGSATPT